MLQNTEFTERQLEEIIAGLRPVAARRTVTFDGGVSSGALSAAATATIDPAGTNNSLDYTAATVGLAGNSIRIRYVDPGVDGASIRVLCTGNDITVNLATDTLTAASTVLTSNNTNVTVAETVTIGSTVYRFETTLAQVGDVKRGASADATLLSLAKTLNGTGVAGTDMFAGTPADPNVSSSSSVTSHTITLTARTKGTAANSLATTTTSSTLSFTGSTLAGGIAFDTITSTAGAIITALAALTESNALVTAANHAANDGTGLVTAMPFTSLASGSGGTVPLFTVSGTCLVSLRGYVETTPTGTAGTLVHGKTGTTNDLITILTGTALTAGGGVDSTGYVARGTALAKTPLKTYFDGQTIFATTATHSIATGKIDYIADFIPLTEGAMVFPT